MRFRPRFTVKRLMIDVAVVALLLFVAIGQKPRRIIEPLASPVAVTGWSGKALHLADGRDLPLPDMVELPLSSAALAEATSRGVEVASDGRVYGQMRISCLRCGFGRSPMLEHLGLRRTPISEHLARVDLSLLLQFLGQGRFAAPPVPTDVAWRDDIWFEPTGWDRGAYREFQHWREMVAEKRAAARGG